MADAYWKHGSVCEEYSAIQCPVYAVGGWTDGYTNAIPRLLTHLTVPRKGLIGPWAHGVMDEPMLRAWMTKSVEPAPHHEKLPGRWIAKPSWPPPNTWVHRLFITDDGLQVSSAELTPRDVCSPQTVGKNGGSWCPFGRGADQAGDQQKDDVRVAIRLSVSAISELPRWIAPSRFNVCRHSKAALQRRFDWGGQVAVRSGLIKMPAHNGPASREGKRS